jgi:hypothetical protein
MLVSSKNLPFIGVNLLATLFDSVEHSFHVVGRDGAGEAEEGVSWGAARGGGSECASEFEYTTLGFVG